MRAEGEELLAFEHSQNSPADFQLILPQDQKDSLFLNIFGARISLCTNAHVLFGVIVIGSLSIFLEFLEFTA